MKDALSDVDLLSLDLGAKIALLERIAQMMIDLRLEIAQVSGHYAELRANLEVLKQVKSALQSAIRAEMTQ